MLRRVAAIVSLAALAACNGVRGALPPGGGDRTSALRSSGFAWLLRIQNDSRLRLFQHTTWRYCMNQTPAVANIAPKGTHAESIELDSDIVKCGAAAFTTQYKTSAGALAEFDFTFAPANRHQRQHLDAKARGYDGLCAVATLVAAEVNVRIFQDKAPAQGCSSFKPRRKAPRVVTRTFTIENATGARLYQDTKTSYCLVQTPFSETLDAGVTKDNRIMTKSATGCDYAADFLTTYSEPQTPTSYVWVHWYLEAPNVRLDMGQRGILCGTQLGMERIRIHRC